MAYTNAHPNEFPDVNIYYARMRDGKIERVGGEQIGSLDDPIAPGRGHLRRRRRAGLGPRRGPTRRAAPVIVFASFAAPDDHRYHYARWDGLGLGCHDITSGRADPSARTAAPDYYSGGLTLDHEDPRASTCRGRSGPPGRWRCGPRERGRQLELAAGERVDREERPRRCRRAGMAAFGGDLSVRSG